jgi:hypothetical protein
MVPTGYQSLNNLKLQQRLLRQVKAPGLGQSQNNQPSAFGRFVSKTV